MYLPVATIAMLSETGIVCNCSIVCRFSFAESAPTNVITWLAQGESISASNLTWEVRFVNIIGVRPSSIAFLTSSTMSLFLTSSVDIVSTICVYVFVSAERLRNVVKRGIRVRVKLCLFIWLLASAVYMILPHCINITGWCPSLRMGVAVSP